MAMESCSDHVFSRNARCLVCMCAIYRDGVSLSCGHPICGHCASAYISQGRGCPSCGAMATIAGEYREEVPQRGTDTNVFEIKLYKLAEDSLIATGEPISCKSCSAVLTCFSSVEADEGGKLWKCEYCGYPNKLVLEAGQIPSADQVTYVLDPAPEAAAAEGGDSTTCIFSIDTSGSMGTTVPVATPISIKGSRPTNRPTRLNCVMAAVEAQITQMIEQSPSRHIGLVEFESSVTVHGDGFVSDPVQVNLNDFEGLVQSMANKHDYYVGRTVATAKNELMTKVLNLVPKGMTALGPGLVVSVALAVQGKGGSKVIICTDGMANQGIGAIENLGEEGQQRTDKFYEDVGMWAQRSGVSVSVISVSDADCKLSYLSNIANLTEGNVLRVNPATLADDFANVLSERIVATEAKVRVTMHKGLKFKNEVASDLQLQGSQLVRTIGNVSQYSSFTFEYAIKNEEEMTTSEVDLRGLEQLPFQLVIEYRNLAGQRCVKTFAKILKVSSDREFVEREARADVLHRNWGHQQARRVEQGYYRQMEEVDADYQSMVGRVARTEEEKAQVEDMERRMRGIVAGTMAQVAIEERMGLHINEEEADPSELRRQRQAMKSDSTTVAQSYFKKARK